MAFTIHLCSILIKAFINSLEPWIDALLWTSKQKWPFTAIIKVGRDSTFFNITLIVFVLKQNVICN